MAIVVVIGVAVPIVLLTRPDESYPDRWDPRISDLARFVEDQRDLEFEHPVRVDFLTSEEYAARTRVSDAELSTEDRDMLDQLSGYLRALGLASGDIDIVEASNDMAATGTLAFYDPEAKRIVVRGTEMTVNLRVTLVHELTHVLQDQHFDLNRSLEAASRDDDIASRQAFTALVEGDAMRIEYAYVRQLPADELDEYQSVYDQEVADAESGMADVPAAMVASQIAPYVLGEPLVELIADDGGNAAVDDAFADPPTTAEHMFDPRTFLGGDTVTPLDDPALPPTGDEIESGQFGAVELYLVLADRIDPVVALDAADGWGNGRYVVYEDGPTCVRIALDGDTPTDDQQLKQAFDLWAVGTPPEARATVSDLGAGTTLVESCDPGTGVDATDDRALDVLAVPAARAQIALSMNQQGATVDEAWATGDCFVRHLTLEELLAGNEAGGPSPEVRDRLMDAYAACGQ